MTDEVALESSPVLSSPSKSPEAANSSDSPNDDTPEIQPTNGKASPPPASESANIPPSKTDKPRPHVCGTCGRSFARLEHLKRHERSHTKEKPFECPECTRCFARRDLLLRHQQKLHMTTTPSSRARTARRESSSSIGQGGAGKIRKGSINSGTGASVNGAGSSFRPRANTISHIDGGALGILAAQHASTFDNNDDFKSSLQHNGFRGLGTIDPRDMSAVLGNHGNSQNLPRINTQGLGFHNNTTLRTAPPGAMPPMGFPFGQDISNGSTINPAHLHLDDSMDTSASPFNRQNPFGTATIGEEESFEWMRTLNSQMQLENSNDHALAASSPSAMSNGSPPPHGDNLFGDQGLMQNHPGGLGLHHQANFMPQVTGSVQLENDLQSFAAFGLPHEAMLPSNLHDQAGMSTLYNGANSFSILDHATNGMPNGLHSSTALSSDGTSNSSMNGSGRQSSVTSVSTDTITEVTRQSLLQSLAQPSGFGSHFRKTSQPASSSPLSPHSKPGSGSISLPSTADLQRYVNAYIHYFHPHFPFLHVATLSFDTTGVPNGMRPGSGYDEPAAGSGKGCLILAMAAIGALYEFDRPASKELFDGAKKLIQLYLEETRCAEMSAANHSRSATVSQNTPLWLVQAMLLNVVYGHNCGEKVAGDIASRHCAALVSLARAADLVRTPQARLGLKNGAGGMQHDADVQMGDGIAFHDPWAGNGHAEELQRQWHEWIVVEERHRTLYAIFHMSSLLVMAYNHAPVLMNSEIHLDLPCEEELWTADSANAWASRGGLQAAEHGGIPFAHALSTLLMASQTHKHNEHLSLSYNQPFGSSVPLTDLPPSDLRPSTFGCLVLINALHNYIWETRQRHSGRKWTTQETEAMHAHIEPALRAWQAAWAANPTHSLERPNPFGLGPLSADSIPLLDLAYVRLFVNLGSSKDFLWQQDFEGMAEELARGNEIIEHADRSDGAMTTNGNSGAGSTNSTSPPSPKADDMMGDEHGLDGMLKGSSEPFDHGSRSSKRERHLRKAAFYAADSLAMSDKLGVTLADFTSRELPVQSSICAIDCAQVLAEWVATVQDRVGRYLGVIGCDEIDLTQVPAILLLEDEDCRLLDKTSDILKNAEAKMTYEMNNMGASAAMVAMNNLPSVSTRSLGSKVLMVTAYMLERAAVWPVRSLLARALAVQALHMNQRAENSTRMMD